MDREEIDLRELARRKGISLRRIGPDKWSIGLGTSLASLDPWRPPKPWALLSEGRIQTPNGRIYEREMTTASLVEALNRSE